MDGLLTKTHQVMADVDGVVQLAGSRRELKKKNNRQVIWCRKEDLTKGNFILQAGSKNKIEFEKVQNVMYLGALRDDNRRKPVR